MLTNIRETAIILLTTHTYTHTHVYMYVYMYMYVLSNSEVRYGAGSHCPRAWEQIADRHVVEGQFGCVLAYWNVPPDHGDLFSDAEVILFSFTGCGSDAASTEGYQTCIVAVRLFFCWIEREGLYPDMVDHIKGARLEEICIYLEVGGETDGCPCLSQC